MWTAIRNMLKQAFVSLLFDDSEAYPIVQVTSNKIQTKAVRLSVYGVCSNPPANAHALIMNSQAQESTKFAIINDFQNRKKGLKAGEVAIVNTVTGSIVFLKEDGSIEIEATSISLSGDITLDGDVTCNGDLDMAGNDITNPNLVDGVEISTHTHSGVTTGTSNTGPPV